MSETTATLSANKSTSFMDKIKAYKVGVIPWPVYLVAAVTMFAAAYFDKLPKNMIGGFAAIMILGIFLGDLGNRLPIVKGIGGPAILAIFIPSAMVHYGILSPNIQESVKALMKDANFLYLYISCLVAGSILGMNRKVLIQGFIKMFIPLIVGTVAAVVVGVLVGLVFGYTPYDTFFFIIVPIVGGGIGEGILSLSMGYSEILGQTQEAFVSKLIPAALLGNIVAIVCAGYLKRLGERKPHLTGNGMLVKSGDGEMTAQETQPSGAVEFPLMGAGLLIACTFFILGSLLSEFIGIPGPIIMIFSAAIIKSFNVMPAKMEQGAFHIYKFMTGAFTWPLLAGLGIIYIPWKDMIASFTISYFLICAAAVLAMIMSGYYVARFLNMNPVESAIVTGCHSGLGGTGDVAILSASNRMELMPFAQISTRIGGASMVVLATLLLKLFNQ